MFPNIPHAYTVEGDTGDFVQHLDAIGTRSIHERTQV